MLNQNSDGEESGEEGNIEIDRQTPLPSVAILDQPPAGINFAEMSSDSDGEQQQEKSQFKVLGGENNGDRRDSVHPEHQQFLDKKLMENRPDTHGHE